MLKIEISTRGILFLALGLLALWAITELWPVLVLLLISAVMMLGLLPYVAKEVYGVGQAGLGWLAATFSTGALASSLLMGANRLPLKAARAMLIGADQYAKLDTWHRSGELFSLASFAVFGRPTDGAAVGERPRAGVVHVEMEPIAISATDIRARIARGEDVSAMLPAPVLQYIRRHHLYGHS